MRPYDGKQRLYRHTDPDTGPGLAVLRRVLKLPASASISGVRWEMSFYSGGLGTLDRVAVAIPTRGLALTAILHDLEARAPVDARGVASCDEELQWLLFDGEQPESAAEAVVSFVEEERHAFQTQCSAADRVWFVDGSDVNDWAALWESDGVLNFLSASQG